MGINKAPVSKGSKASGLQSTRIDWLAARNEYVSDITLSYLEISKKYGVSRTSVQKRGTREGWAELRQRLADRAYENFQIEMLAQKEKAQSHQLALYQNMQALVLKSIRAIDQNNFMTDRDGAVVRDAEGKPIQIPPSPFALEKLAHALESAINGERVVLGLPTQVTKSENDINMINPYEKYSRDQLEMMWESANAIARSRTAPEAELVSSN